jgi:hypothetical protein
MINDTTRETEAAHCSSVSLVDIIHDNSHTTFNILAENK